MIIVFALIVAGAILAIPAFKVKQEEFKKTGKHPKGHYMGLGIALGLPIGIPIGVALGNIALGPAIGVAIGCAIGAGLEKKHEHELRPMTDREKEMQKRAIYFGLAIFLIGIAVFFITALKVNK